jgi:hypothetical protein
VNAGHVYRREADARPFGGIVWAGEGTINENEVNCTNKEKNEFLVIPMRTLTIKSSSQKLLIYVVFPLQE